MMNLLKEILLFSNRNSPDRSRGVMGLSQKAYIDRTIKNFNMNGCSLGDALLLKGTSFLIPNVLRMILRER